MSRDYAAEMRAVIDAEAQGTYSSPVVAAHIVEKLRATDPGLLRGWLDEQAVQFVRHAINLRDCSVRTHNRVAASRSVFRQAAEDADAGDDEALRSNFLGEVYVVASGMRMPLGDMRKPDVSFAADEFAAKAKQHAMREAFLRAVAAKIGRRCVGEVFDEERLAELWRSLSGPTE
jgi:hypothetical protein